VATITQTNVLTAAQAAAASSGGASGTTAGGAASGGGGGVSGTTLAVVGGVAAGGALVAVNSSGGDAAPEAVTTTYRGAFTVVSEYNTTTTTNGVVTGFCHNQAVTITGTITVTLNDRGAGEIAMEWTENVAAAGQCPSIAPTFRTSGPISSASNITLSSEFPAEYDSPAGRVRLRRVATFSGALDGGVVSGVVTMSEDQTLIAPAGPGIAFGGGYPAASVTVTMVKQ
jgi:hypothetical protein